MKEKSIVLFGLVMLGLMGGLVTPVQAATNQTLRVTSDNLAHLSSGCWGSSGDQSRPALVLYYGSQYCGSSWDGSKFSGTRNLWVNGMPLTQACKGSYCGQCTDFVAAMTGNDMVTGKWHPGRQVVNGGVERGTAIATFVNGHYGGHVAIFWGYTSNGGIYVLDQNWVLLSTTRSGTGGIIGAHEIFANGQSFVGQSGNYWTVEVY